MLDTKEITNKLIALEDDIPIYLVGHIAPDQDSIGSCLSLARFLQKIGKQAFALLKPSDYDILSWQGDYSLIKNEIEEKKYNLIALDINTLDRLDNYEHYFYTAKQTINIDHHAGNTTKANYVFALEDMSSTCEIIYNIINNYDKSFLDKKTCQNLYAGIMTDTNCFSRRLTDSTLIIAQDLINHGVNYDKINKLTLWKRSQEELIAVGLLAKEIVDHQYFKYVVADQHNAPYCDLHINSLTKKIAEDLRKRNDLDIFIMFVIKPDNSVRGKVMTNMSDNADKIASLVGGGGHRKEAGFHTNLSIEEIIKIFDNNKQVFEQI